MTDSVTLGQDQVADERHEAFGDPPVTLHRQPAELRATRARSADSRARTPGSRSPAWRIPSARGPASRHGATPPARRAEPRRAPPGRSCRAASANVGSSRCAISCATVFLKKNDSPRSPRRHLAEPDAELHHDRFVQAEACADLLDLLGRGAVTGDHRRRIARGQAQQQEHHHRDDEQHRDGREEAGGEEPQHA